MEPFIGEINYNGFNFAPHNWHECDGSQLSISENQPLFALLNTFYGGDGRTTFALPDLRGKMAIGQGNFPGSNYDWRVGQTFGNETHRLSELELPNHSHSSTFTPSSGISVSLEATTTQGDSETPLADSYLAKFKEVGAGGDDYIYSSTPGTKVELGGISANVSPSTGSVTIGSNGGSQQFNIIQTMQVVECSISMLGIFPSRN